MRGVEGQGPGQTWSKAPYPLLSDGKDSGSRKPVRQMRGEWRLLFGKLAECGAKRSLQAHQGEGRKRVPFRLRLPSYRSGTKGQGPGADMGQSPIPPLSYGKDNGRRKPVRQIRGRRLLLFGKLAECGAKRSLQAHQGEGRKRVPFRLRLPSYRSGAKGQGPG